MAAVEIRGDIARLLRRASEAQLEAIRQNGENALQRNVPRDTGELAESCYATLNAELGVIRMGATADHAEPVENGHITQAGTFVPPNPFVRRSVSEATRGRR